MTIDNHAACGVTSGSSTASAVTLAVLGALGVGATASAAAPGKFQVEEATISQIHEAITSGATTCKGVVEAYI